MSTWCPSNRPRPRQPPLQMDPDVGWVDPPGGRRDHMGLPLTSPPLVLVHGVCEVAMTWWWTQRSKAVVDGGSREVG